MYMRQCDAWTCYGPTCAMPASTVQPTMHPELQHSVNSQEQTQQRGLRRYQEHQQTVYSSSARQGAALLRAEQDARSKLAHQAPAVLGKQQAKAKHRIAAQIASSAGVATLEAPSRSAPGRQTAVQQQRGSPPRQTTADEAAGRALLQYSIVSRRSSSLPLLVSVSRQWHNRTAVWPAATSPAQQPPHSCTCSTAQQQWSLHGTAACDSQVDQLLMQVHPLASCEQPQCGEVGTVACQRALLRPRPPSMQQHPGHWQFARPVGQQFSSRSHQQQQQQQGSSQQGYRSEVEVVHLQNAQQAGFWHCGCQQHTSSGSCGSSCFSIICHTEHRHRSSSSSASYKQQIWAGYGAPRPPPNNMQQHALLQLTAPYRASVDSGRHAGTPSSSLSVSTWQPPSSSSALAHPAPGCGVGDDDERVYKDAARPTQLLLLPASTQGTDSTLLTSCETDGVGGGNGPANNNITSSASSKSPNRSHASPVAQVLMTCHAAAVAVLGGSNGSSSPSDSMLEPLLASTRN